MMKNIIVEVQEKMDIPALVKIDPNTQEVPVEYEQGQTEKFHQAILTAVMAGIFEAGKVEEKIEHISNAPLDLNWASEIFGENKTRVLENISRYTSYPVAEIEITLNKIAMLAIDLIRTHAQPNERLTDIKNLIAGQRDYFLPYLPAALQMGKLTNDNTLDDNTNKMEGPISSLMNKIQSSFGSAETREDAASKTNK